MRVLCLAFRGSVNNNSSRDRHFLRARGPLGAMHRTVLRVPPKNGKSNLPLCQNCGKMHKGRCIFGSDTCSKCWKPRCISRDCPQLYNVAAQATIMKQKKDIAHVGVFALTQDDTNASNDVVIVIISLFSTMALVLYDLSATYFFISLAYACNCDRTFKPLICMLFVVIPLGDHVVCWFSRDLKLKLRDDASLQIL